MKTEQEIAERVQKLWATHETKTIFEDGLYRHYRINLPEAHSWVEIITWPGHLTITGDLSDTYTFAREDDMLRDFFHAAHGPDYSYWASKLTIPEKYDATHEWDEEKFAADVKELADDEALSEDAIEEAEWVEDLYDAVKWQRDHDATGSHMGMQWQYDYQRACHLIGLFADEYRKGLNQ